MTTIRLTLIAAFLLCLTQLKAGAQTLSFIDAGSASFANGLSTDFSIDLNDSVVNGYATSKNVIWSVQKVSGPTEWSFTNCDNASCYNAKSPYVYLTNAGSTTPLIMNPGDTNIGMFHVYIHSKDGSGVYAFHYWVAGDSANTVVTRMVNVNVAFVNGIAKATITPVEIKIFPIPAVDAVTVDLNANNNVKRIEIYNLIGSKVVTLNAVNANKNEINVSNLTPGMYFVKLIDAKNSVITTKTFQKK